MSSAALAKADKRARVLVTPEGIAVPVKVASRASRFGALALDFMFLNIALVLFQICSA